MLNVNTICKMALGMMVSGAAYGQAVWNDSTVIRGKLTISGAEGGNRNKVGLGDAALESLCEQGYTLAVYVYQFDSDSTFGRSKGNRTIECSGGKQIKYYATGDFRVRSSRVRGAIDDIDQAIRSNGKVLVHCRNGVHASKYVAAAAMTKLCGYDGDAAKAYWLRNLAGGLGRDRVNQLAADLDGLRESTSSVVSGCP